ncbi:DEAD/DEAH box helicase [Sorangium sp. So ce1036]|uniref:DEAD/DEAH box helicase n=1 Tax=Sorangium sp. So ce1036 TaxID=3133328 RepID=UPI003F0561DD
MFHPVVDRWFRSRFGAPAPAQERAWPVIASGRDTLICAPTGAGKTLAAFLFCLDRLVRDAERGALDDRTDVLYISPLKALSHDVHRNLEQPIAEIAAAMEAAGLPRPGIRAVVRTGDSPAQERRAMAARPPHVLVTTPESAFILLTSASGRRALSGVRTVILDEVHAVAGDKRGAHLALSLERLEDLVVGRGGPRPQRVGLSATVRPVEIAARLVSGARDLPEIVDVGQRRDLDLAIEVPRDELGAVCTNEQWAELYDRLAALAAEARSTLVFVNTRRLVERVSHALAARLGEDVVAAHHGSLSRARRLSAERRLKAGELRVVVATASLELGIDVGAVDLACLVGSPRSINVALQRVGRSGHALSATPRGRLFPLTRDQLVECAAIVRAARRGELDRMTAREGPLDVLAQQIIAACACEERDEEGLYALVRRAAPYEGLSRRDFDAVVAMISGGAAGAADEGAAAARGARQRAGALVYRDALGGRLRGRRGARLAALTSGGAIPDLAAVDVLLQPDGTKVGTLDEDFAIESNAGDVFLLGNTSWRVLRMEGGQMWVEDAHGAAPTVPFWLGEAPARTPELSAEVAALRAEIAARLEEERAGGAQAGAAAGTGGLDERALREQGRLRTARWLMEACALDERGALLVRDYIEAGRAALGAVPGGATVVVERFFDEAGGQQIVVHTPLGGRVNRALGLALRKRFCRSFDFELQAAATDDGVLLSLSAEHGLPVEEVLDLVRPEGLEEVLVQAALQGPMFRTRFRWAANRALALLRYRGGRRVPPALQRMRADDLLLSIFPEQQGCQDNHGLFAHIEPPDHPLVREALRDCLVELMDVEGLRALLVGVRSGAIRVVALDTPEPSVFSHEILNANPYAFLDDAPLEERRARAVRVRRGLPAEVVERLGGLDPEVIAEVVAEARPDARDADELHELLLDRVALPADEGIRGGFARLFEALCAAGRAAEVSAGRAAEVSAGRAAEGSAAPPAPGAGAPRAPRWVATERRPLVEAIWPGAVFAPDVAVPPALRAATGVDRGDAIVALVRGFLSGAGPVSTEELARRLEVPASEALAALARIELSGGALRGRFRPSAPARAAQAGAGDAGDVPAGGASAGAAGAAGDLSIEWCDRRLLARIHRRTVTGLRKAIEPATAAELLRFLLAWQGVRPGTQARGPGGLGRVIEQLQGFELAAGAWEREVLPARVAGYDERLLDALCLSGEVAWGRVVPRDAAAPTRAAPITLALRRDLPWLLAPREPEGAPPPAPLSEAAQGVLSFLSRAGASFFDDLAAGAGRSRAEVEEALWELVAAGLVTGDGFAALRSLLGDGGAAGVALGAGRLRGGGRRAGPVASGRWSLLRARQDAAAPGGAPEGAGEGSDGPDVIEALAHQYLRRYGVVCRELLAREPRPPAWRDLVRVYRRLEMAGELRGGHLVAGFVGEHFALPEALDALRAVRREPPSGEIVQICACDPLNLVGIVTPGPRVPAVLGNVVIYRDGVPLAPVTPAAVERGRAVSTAAGTAM